MQSPDFPPVPRCFSHLLVHVTVNNQPCRGSRTITDVNDQLKTDFVTGRSSDSDRNNEAMISELPPFPKQLDTGVDLDLDLRCVQNDSHNSPADGLNHDIGLDSIVDLELDLDLATAGKSTLVIDQHSQQKPHCLEELAYHSLPSMKSNMTESSNPTSPYTKLNSSLQRLQKEMKDLRYLDISLFCQLVSLHESIQDFKLTMADRFSETGSEYSMGTASYMGSMSSLSEESDWAEDGTILPCSPQSVENMEDYNGDGHLDGSRQSASSLLQQITDLALKAEEDF